MKGDSGSTIEAAETIARSIDSCLSSPNVADSNGECANVVDVLQYLAKGAFAIAKSIEAVAIELRKAREK